MSDIATGPIPRLRLEPGPPGARLLFLVQSISDEVKGFEVLGGRLTPKRRTAHDTVVANDLLRALFDHNRDERHGFLQFGVLLDLPEVEDFYRPEITFVPYTTWPESKPFPDGEAWSVVPSLVVEVGGRHRTDVDLVARTAAYLRVGVGAVWVVRTESHECHTITATGEARVLTRADELTGDPVIPGFWMALAGLFPAVAPSV